MTDLPRIILKRLAFTGSEKKAELEFIPGLNVLWGASNAGKSFTLKALDFMFGAGSPLPDIKEREGYESCWLELDLPKSGQVTLYRALAGGALKLFDEKFETAQSAKTNRILTASHTSKGDSLSSFLLDELGVSDKKIARKLTGETSAFTFRHFASYVLTEETPMMAEWSPIRIAAQSGETFDKNVLKFILTGNDDADVVVGRSVGDQRTANAGKIEIVEEMIASSTEELRRLFPDDEDLDALDLTQQDERLSSALAEFQSRLARRQAWLDNLRRDRRAAHDAREELHARALEIRLTLGRFDLLANVYRSDIERLVALEEGAAALMAGARRKCPLCGADPEHQHEIHGLDQVALSQRAVRAEIAKIKAESSDLSKTATSLRAESEGIGRRGEIVAERIVRVERLIERLKPAEASGRAAYEALDKVRRRVRDGLSAKDRITKLKARKQALEAFRPTSTSRDSIAVGVPKTVGHDFAMIVQDILRQWQFPGNPVVSFNDRTHDILINGSDRPGNGKGVRALMNAAFKIGVLLYCREHRRPHPGIVALDSPLLSYRDPHTSRYGDLSADEQAVTASGLNEHFYQYLLSLSGSCQFVIIENDAPPLALGDAAKVTRFVGPTGQGGRQGLL